MKRLNIFFALLCFVVFYFSGGVSLHSQSLNHTPEQFLESISRLSTNQAADTLSAVISNFNLSDEEFDKLTNYLISILENAKTSKSIAEAYYDIGKSYQKRSKFEEAETNLKISVQKYIELKDSVQTAFVFRNLGNLQTLKGDFSAAIQSLLSAVKIYESIGEAHPKKLPPSHLAHSYTALGIIFKDIGKRKEAFDYYFLAEKVYRQLNDSIGIAGISNNIGMLYEKDSLYKEALKYYSTAENISKKLRNDQLRSIILINLGSVSINLNEIDKAKKYFEESLDISKKINRKKGIVTANMNLANIFYKKKEYAKSIEKYNSAIALSEELGEIMLKIEAYQNISISYEKIGDFKNSLDFARKHYTLKDSLLNAEINLQIFDLNTKYKTEQKEKELQALKLKETKEKVQRQKTFINIIIAAVFLAIITAAVFIRLYYQKRKLARELKVAKEIAEKANKLKTEIIANMNHEIRTPLNFIKSSAALIKMDIEDESNPELVETLDYLDSGISRLTRTLELFTDLSSLKSGNYAPHPEVIDLKRICESFHQIYSKEIEKAQKQIEFTFDYQIEEAYIKADERNTEKIIEFIIDNAVKFTQFGKIWLNLNQKSSEVYQIIIEDTGIGIAEEYKDKIFEPFSQEDMSATRQYDGIGLSLALAYEYALINNFKINFDSAKGKGTRFMLEFPIYDIDKEL